MVRKLLIATVATWVGALASLPARADDFVALGDSITFGETDLIYSPSYGDRGYVADVADDLAAQTGGSRPKVINLAIDGETTSSFFSNSGRTPPVEGRGDAPLQLENLNYTSNAMSQSMLFAQTVAAQEAAGQSISDVSLTLGFNNLAALASLPPAQAQADIPSTLATFQSQYADVLSDIRSLTPNANLYLLGYYNPFPADPLSPAAPIFDSAGSELNSIISMLASQYGAKYVDVAPSFVGRESELTYEAAQPVGFVRSGDYGGVEPIGDVHPNATGYAVIAGQIEQASAAPEPAAWTLLFVGVGLIGASLRRGKRRPFGDASPMAVSTAEDCLVRATRSLKVSWGVSIRRRPQSAR